MTMDEKEKEMKKETDYNIKLGLSIRAEIMELQEKHKKLHEETFQTLCSLPMEDLDPGEYLEPIEQVDEVFKKFLEDLPELQTPEGREAL